MVSDSAIQRLANEIRKFRDAATTGGGYERLIKDKRKHSQLCASMDAIEDTSRALSYYTECRPEPNQLARRDKAGRLYLMVYGVLQAIVIQQDAICNAAEAIGFAYELSADAKEIREIRNCAVGHPTKRDRKKQNGPESFGINMSSLTWDKFAYYSFDKCSAEKQKKVNIPGLIDQCAGESRAALKRMSESLTRNSNT